jgi:hypothetical protein
MRSAKTKSLALSAILSALGVVLMYFGAIVQVMDLTMVCIASLFTCFAVMELRGHYPLMIWGVTAFLSLLLVPDKFGALCYTLLLGFYPILKPKIDSHGRLVRVFFKLIGFNLLLTAMLASAKWIFHLPEDEIGLTWAFYPLGNAAFFLYDLAIDRLTMLYLLRLRRAWRIERYLGRR